MTMQVKCPGCGKQLQLPNSARGKRGKCPQCGEKVAIPAVEGGGGDGDGAPPAAVRPSRAEAKPPPPVGKLPKGQAVAAAADAAPVQTEQAAPVKAVSASAVPVGKAIPAAPPSDQGQVGELDFGSQQAFSAAGSSLRSRRHSRRRGTPVWLWVLLLVGGAGAAGGWAYYLSGSAERLAKRQSDQKSEKPPVEESAEDEGKDSPSQEQKKVPKSTTPESAATDRSRGPATESTQHDSPAKQDSAGKKTSPFASADSQVATGDAFDAAFAADQGDTVQSDSDTAQPAPATNGADPSVARYQQLLADCTKFDWQPKTLEEFASLGELATRMLAATSPEAQEAANRALAQLVSVDWREQRAKAMNRWAALTVTQSDLGTVFIGTVLDHPGSQPLIHIDHTDRVVALPDDRQLPDAPPGSKWLVVGAYTKMTLPVEPENLPQGVDATVGDAVDAARVVRLFDAIEFRNQ